MAVSRIILDAISNKIKEISPNNYDASKDTTDATAITMTGISYTYDKMNRLISTLSPEGNVIEYNKYDPNVNILKKVDGLRFNGNVDTKIIKAFITGYFTGYFLISNFWGLIIIIYASSGWK